MSNARGDDSERPGSRDGDDAERTVDSVEPDRIDTNEKADDVATVVQPDGRAVDEPHPSDQGRA